MKPLSRYFIEMILSYGMIAGLLIIIVRAAVYLLDVNQANTSFAASNFVYNIIVLSLCLYFGTIAYRKKNNTGNLSYLKGLSFCLVAGFVSIFLIYVYDLIFHIFIAPDYLAKLLEPQMAAISENPAIQPRQKMQIMLQLEKYASPYYVASLNALMSFGLSIIISLIIAVFTVRRRPVVIENTEETSNI